jgi:hypothetical protein
MASRRGNLQPAHKGYRYQDIWTAYILVRAVAERYDQVTVDKKQVHDDRIDDLEVVSAGRRVRRQLKSSHHADRHITEEDFTSKASSLRIDRLVLTQVRAGATSAAEYRLCATWQPANPEDDLVRLLEEVEAEPTIEGWQSRHFRILGGNIWPANAEPTWEPLKPYNKPGAEFCRADFLAFCDRFLIELSLPLASTDLLVPGPLEQALIKELSDRIGIGRYPNHVRDPADVAALAISLANLARTQEATLSPDDVVRELAIRTDFGRVAQSFPIDENLFHDRPVFRRVLKEGALKGEKQLVIAPPGAGKSWELTRLAHDLVEAGVIVARHYCYLQPGDELVEKRVTTDVFFGNILGELVDACPDLLGASDARYAAGLQELESTLEKAATLRRPVVLIIDGLDHISRVRYQARSLADEDTDIVERLSTLRVPNGISVLVGSQPGKHLDPLREQWNESFFERLVPPWSEADIAELAKLHGAVSTLKVSGINEDEKINELLSLLSQRADGNPLYAHYLARGLTLGLREGVITNPVEWLSGVPIIAGDIAVYYEHLYRKASAEAQAIADLMGVIDFAVTENDLREMLPAFLGAWLPSALSGLSPVLTASAGQGGIRIFHESFRRFMTEELARKGRSLADVLDPVIRWLENRGFLADAKSYRFLLPALRRADRDSDVLALVNVSFVSDSVTHAHPLDAIQRNLALAADVAATSLDWPALIRCIELHRSAYTCFDESQNTWQDYWTTYLHLFSAAALSERLLFDGRPTQPITTGLFACSLIDDAGGTAPWREYLREVGDQFEDDSPHSSDSEGALSSTEHSLINITHGRLRLGERKRVLNWFLNAVVKGGKKWKPLFVRKLAARIARMEGPELIERVCRRRCLTGKMRKDVKRSVTMAFLGIADEYARRGEILEAKNSVTLAVDAADQPEIAVSCVVYGAPTAVAIQAALALSSISIGIGEGEYLHEATGVRNWVASVRLVATDSVNGLRILEREKKRVEGIGWYRCWLRFVIGISTVEAAKRNGEAGDIVNAFNDLSHDVEPFSGQPRPCDLYPIRNVIRETIEVALGLLENKEEWQTALYALSHVCQGTGSSIDREDSGPLPVGTLLDLIIPYIVNPIAGPLVRSLIEQEVDRIECWGSYYSTHAEYAMRLARSMLADGRPADARIAWGRAAVYLCSYGWHKDVTVYEVIASAPALVAVSREVALSALAQVQVLSDSVLTHTDGRSTKGAPNAWYRKLLKVAPAGAIALLARTIVEDEGIDSWPIEEAIRDSLIEITDIADPALVDALFSTLRFEIEYEGQSIEAADERLAPVVRLASVDRDMAEECLRRVIAEVRNDGRRYTDAAAARIESTAYNLNLRVPHRELQPQLHVQANDGRFYSRDFQLRWMRVPPFPPTPRFVDILLGLKSSAAQQKQWDDPYAWDSVVLPLSYLLTQLVDNRQEDDARRLLRYFARDVYVSPSGKIHPIGKIAEALDVAGYADIAAFAYALAYTSTRGGSGYHSIGDRKHSHVITRGIELNSKIVHKVVADEVAYSLRGSWYSIGASQHLIERIAEWGDPQVAETTWREAFSVISHRLPLPKIKGLFARLDVADIPAWSIDESLVALLLVRISEPRLRRKIAALAGVVRAIQNRPEAVSVPLNWWMRQDVPTTSLLLIMNGLWEGEKVPFVVTKSVANVLHLYASSYTWGARIRAGSLLERAGITTPPIPSGDTNSPKKVPETGLSADRRSALLSLDTGRTLTKLGEMWPELPNNVLGVLDLTLKEKVHQERGYARYRLAYGRDGDSLPSTPVLHWEAELFVSVFHDEMSRLREYLWSIGQWKPGLEEALLSRVLPNTRLHLGLAASRTVRPNLIEPVNLVNGESPLSVLGADDPAYSGWVRIGRVERQYLHDVERRYSPASEVVTVFAGAFAIPFGFPDNTGCFPFDNGDVSDWWTSNTPRPFFPPQLPIGHVVCLTRVTDWLGDELVMIPPLMLRSYIHLYPPTYAAPLIWKDEAGNPAIALRTWRVINPEALFAEPAEFIGSDLVVRPDIAGKMRQLYGAELREIRVLNRDSLSEKKKS